MAAGGFKMDVRVNVQRAQRKLFHVRDKAVNQAAARALNRTIKQVKTSAVRELKDEIGKATGLTSAGLKKSIKEHKANRRRLTARLVPSGRAIPLIRFGARQVKQGVTAAAWGKRKAYKGAFITKMKSGRKGVFARTSKKRLPIKELYGPALPKEFSKGKIISAMKRRAATAWRKNWRRELKFALSKVK